MLLKRIFMYLYILYMHQIRAGWHCNPGATYTAMKFNDEDIKNYLKNSDYINMCSASTGIAEINGRPVGAVRSSLGYFSSIDDCDKFISFLQKYIE